ncbi:class II fructose-bisphosphate aldolase [Nocardia sp. NBC_00511]|uniref:class II fructose-bisphosphate aldolase n=1 Tax=Nocardia sp. NBC_00511 TaxID=2903591 RepID=UPI0030DE47D5
MSLLPLPELFALARPGGLAAFNVITLEHAEAIVSAAEITRRPVVLQISENTVRYHGGLEPLAVACLRLAARSPATLAVHLDHATSRELISEAVEVGIDSVMFDGSALDYSANVTATSEIVAWCHDRDVHVEAELGEIGGKDGAHAPGARTDPDQAVEFVTATGVDALAVAVGSSHAMHTRDARLDFDLIEALTAKVGVPLVLHGSSGVPDAGLRGAVEAGMDKINLATRLNIALTEGIRAVLLVESKASDPRRYLGAGRNALRDEGIRLIRILDV